MRRFLILITIYTCAVIFWLVSDRHSLSEEKYVDKKVLELSMPFDVKIDVELLNSLKYRKIPADE